MEDKFIKSNLTIIVHKRVGAKITSGLETSSVKAFSFASSLSRLNKLEYVYYICMYEIAFTRSILKARFFFFLNCVTKRKSSLTLY